MYCFGMWNYIGLQGKMYININTADQKVIEKKSHWNLALDNTFVADYVV